MEIDDIDDTTASEIVHKRDVSNAQSITSQIRLYFGRRKIGSTLILTKRAQDSFACNREEFHAVVVEEEL